MSRAFLLNHRQTLNPGQQRRHVHTRNRILAWTTQIYNAGLATTLTPWREAPSLVPKAW